MIIKYIVPHIYGGQEELFKVQQQVVDDTIRAASLLISKPDGAKFTTAQLDAITERIGMIQMRLILLDSLVDSLDKAYQQFQSEHS
jgi:hypothetical protein